MAGRPRPGTGKYRFRQIIPYIEEHFRVKTQPDRPVQLLKWQADVLRGIFWPSRLPRLAVAGSVKKSGKSVLAGAVGQYFLTEVPMSENYILAPDREHGEDIIYESLCQSIRLHPILSRECKIQKDVIYYRDSFLKVRPCELSISGLRPTLTLVDEAWQFRTPQQVRVLDEMTANPVGNHLTFCVTYAGYQEDQTEDLHLWRWFSRGKAIQAGKEEPDPNFFFYWKEDYAGIPWVEGTDYLEHQRKTLSPASYERFHKNQWSASFSVFITPDILDRCVVPGLERGDAIGWAVAGIDIGVMDDNSAGCVVGPGSECKLRLCDHGLWRPQPGKPVELEQVERRIYSAYVRYGLTAVLYDPSQCYRMAQALTQRGVNMVRYNQTVGNMVTASQNLLTLLRNQQIELYESPDVRSHLLNASAKESGTGGVRIVKGSTKSHKVDLAIALALAAHGATQQMGDDKEVYSEIVGYFGDIDTTYNEPIILPF